MCIDVLEDWVRPPVSREDLALRARTLLARASRRAPRPAVDDNGVLWCGGQWLPLPALEARIMRLLAAAYGDVVTREELIAAAWPDPEHRPVNSLNLHILRLRRRISALGIGIRTARGHGYALVAGAAGDSPSGKGLRRPGDGSTTVPERRAG